MGNRISRVCYSKSVALTNSASTTPNIDFQEASGGTVIVPTGSSITTLTYYAAKNPAAAGSGIGEPAAGDFQPLQDSTGAAVVQTVAASKAFPLPDACFGCGWLRIKANAAGSVDLTLKG